MLQVVLECPRHTSPQTHLNGGRSRLCRLLLRGRARSIALQPALQHIPVVWR
jgi:hypothetical protein